MVTKAKTSPPPRASGFAPTKEAVESILFALILAFVFRGFIGQAFVIPTGSMAPTLLGAHLDHVCSNCGYSYAVSLDRYITTGEWPTRVKCPNCNWEEVPNESPTQAEAGDGIFTVCWPFAVGTPYLDPKRWEVIVFKAPFNMPSGPKGISPDRDGQTNYIKRLVGLPNDVLSIIDGDIYVAPAASLPEPIHAKLQANPPQKLTDEELAEVNRLLQIARKPAKVQDSLWQVVFDADYPPRSKSVGWVPQQPKSGWKTGDRTFQFTGADNAQPQFLKLQGKDFRDNCRYNYDRADEPRYPSPGTGKSIVSDLQLRCAATWQGGNGRIVLRLSKRDRLYSLELSPADGTGRVVSSSLDGSGPSDLGTLAFRPWKQNWPVELTFQNVDRQLSVSMADKVIWQSPATSFSAADALKEPPEILPPIVQVGAADLKLELRHLAVMRDLFYRDDVPVQVVPPPNQRIAGKTAIRYADLFAGGPGWATRNNPMLLRPDEYFMLGDNSPASYDSRAWGMQGPQLAGRDYRFGTVPADQLVGRAFFVYWPSWYRLFGLRLIPNIGQLRWIE